MANKISSRDLFEKEDIFKGIRDSADKTIQKLDKFKTELKGIATSSKKAFGSLKIDNAKGINDLIKLVEKANKVNQQAIQIDQAKQTATQQKVTAERELIAIEREKEKLTQEQLKTSRMKSQQEKREQTERRKKIKAIEQENDAYKKLAKNTRDLKNESKRLGAEMLALESSGKKNTKAYRDLELQYRKVTKSAKKGDAQLKKLDKTVGDNFRNVGNYKNALAGLRTGLAQLGIAFGIGSVVRTGVESIVEFDQAVADLSAITGAGGKDLEFYKQKANELGIGVEGGASAVIEAYKLIGSAKPELLDNAEALNQLTESAITLSQASGMTLPEASKNLTDAMNQFGASADEAGKFIDVLASGSKFGSAEIPQITEALLKFGAIAKSSNVSVQESTALIELLAENGQKGAEAGTKLRNVMLKLASPDALPKEAQESLIGLGISFETLSDETIPFQERLEELTPLLEDNTAMTQVFGVQNVVAGQIILDNTERLAELTVQMDTNGVAQEQANKRTNALGFGLMELKNSFISLFTSMASGEGSFQIIIDGLRWLGQNLPQIINVLGRLLRAFLIYKTTMIALRTAQKLYLTDFRKMGKEFAKQIPLTKAYRLEQEKVAKGVKNSGTAVKGFGKAFASIGIFLIISAVTELAFAFYDLASGAKQAREEQEKQAKKQADMDKAMNKNQRDLQARDEHIRKWKDKDIKAIEKELREKNLLAKTEKEERKNELEALEKKKKVIKKILDEEKKQVVIHEEKLRLANKELQRQIRQENPKFRQKYIIAVKELEQTQESLNNNVDEYQDILDNLTITEKEQVKERKKQSKGAVKTVRTYNTELQDTNEYLSKQRELLEDINRIQQQREIEGLDQVIDSVFEDQIKNIQETGNFEVEYLNNLINLKAEKERQYIEDKVKFEQESVDLRIKRTNKTELDALKKQRDNLIKGADNNNKAIKKINANFEIKKTELENEQKKRFADGETEKVKIYEKGQNDILKVNEKTYEQIEENNEEFQNEVDEFNEKKADEQKQKDDDELDKIKTREQEKRALYKATADFFIQQSQKRIKAIDEELAKAQEQQSFLQDLAKNGNIKAEQSLAENQKIIEEANRKKEAELKKQERIKLAQSVYSTYSSKVEAQVENPLAETIRDVTLLQAFINSLPAFHDGTEDTGSNGRGIDGKGGFQAILHPNERVIPKALNDKIGSMSNEDLTSLAIQYQNEGIIRGKIQTERSDITLLVDEVKDLKQVIQDKPEFSAEVGKITQTSFEILERTKTKNTTDYNRFNRKA